MLDTIILKIPKNDYWITDYKKFGTTKEAMENFSVGFASFINNPTSEEKKRGTYKPCLTIYRRGVGLDLQIQFSAPKLLFNNNLDELEQADFDRVVKTLIEKLADMGVKVWTYGIENAKVLSFHPSKNIPLNGGYTATFAIRELAKIDISKKFDVDFKNYRNNGQALQFYTNSHAIVLYDKINDLNKAKNRAIDQEQTMQQLSIFKFIKEKQPRLEILRLEIRLSKKVKMNEILEKVGYSPNPLFKDVFKKDLCQKILNLYWTKFFSNNPFIYSTNNDPQEILQKIFMILPAIKNAMAYKYVGIYMLCKAEGGIRGLRQIIESRRIYKVNWELAKKEFEKFEDEIFSNSAWKFLQDIKRELKEFKPFKIIH
ncbi:MAG: hypothetical protein ABH830_04745 [Patescibacteria group bacterium]